jgi:hypothetical protein
MGRRQRDRNDSDSSNSSDSDADSLYGAPAAGKAGKTGKDAKPSAGVYDKNGLKLASECYRDSLPAMRGSTLYYIRNGIEMSKCYMFQDPEKAGNIQMTRGAFVVKYKTEKTISLRTFFGNKVPETVSQIKEYLDNQVKDEGKKPVFIQSPAYCIYGLSTTGVRSTRPTVPLFVKIGGLQNLRISTPCRTNLEGGKDEIHLAALLDGAPPTKIIDSERLATDAQSTFLGAYAAEDAGKDTLDVWGTVSDKHVNVIMDKARFWWFGRNLPDLVMKYRSPAPTGMNKLPDSITEPIFDKLSELSKKHETRGHSLAVDNSPAEDYIGEILRTINPQINEKQVHGSRQVAWSFQDDSDVYRVPKEFLEWVHKQYQIKFGDIRTVSPSQMEMQFAHYRDPNSFSDDDEVCFTAEVEAFNPTLLIHTEVVKWTKQDK